MKGIKKRNLLLRQAHIKIDMRDLYLFSAEITELRSSIKSSLYKMRLLKRDMERNRNALSAEILESRYEYMQDKLCSKWAHYRSMQVWLNSISMQIAC